jgi:metallo-beta-lactamase class B
MFFLVVALLCVSIMGCQSVSSTTDTPIQAPLTSARPPSYPPWLNPPPGTDLNSMEPTRLFDNFYYVGTKSVGSFIVDTGDGLIMIDNGWGEKDCALMVNDMKKLGLNPANIKLIILSHEHIDHYGGTQYLKNTVCPNAKVALTLIGWNYLRTRPIEGAYDNPRPKSIDMFLTDGQRITLGNTTIQIVFTPGHSMGCVSFIIPVKDNGVQHTIGVMGGTSVQPNWDEAFLYYSSIEYFKEACTLAKCDIGLGVHAMDYAVDMTKLRERKPGDANPLVIGTEKFNTVYLQKYRDMFQTRVKQLQPDGPSPPPVQPK